MARSREIGWGSVNIGLYTWEKDLSCECIPSAQPTGCAPFWVDNLDLAGRPLDPNPNLNDISSTLDNNCNVYSVGAIVDFTPPSNGDNQYVYKINSDGTLAWAREIIYEVSPFDTDGLPYKIAVDATGNVYILYVNGLIKLDASGNVLWTSFYQAFFDVGLDLNLFNAFDLVLLSDGTPVSVWITGDFNEEYPVIIKHDPVTGAILANTKLAVATNPTYSFEDGASFIRVDSSDNIFIPLLLQNPSFTTVFIKLDSSLNILWSKVLNPSGSTYLSDLDCYYLSTDSAGNIYSITYGGEVVKIDGATGDVLLTFIPTLNGNPLGQLFGLIGITSDNKILFNSGTTIFSYDTDGNFLWAYDMVYIGVSGIVFADRGQSFHEVLGTNLSFIGTFDYGPFPSNRGLFHAKLPTIDLSGVVAADYQFDANTNVWASSNASTIVSAALGMVASTFTPTPETPPVFGPSTLFVLSNNTLP